MVALSVGAAGCATDHFVAGLWFHHIRLALV
jgi:hypothetical protein